MWRALLSLLLVGGIAVLLLAGGFVVFTAALPGSVQDTETKTDVIVVLTGGTARVETGFALLEQGLARRLFISGVAPEVELPALLAAADRPRNGAECCIVLGREAGDTPGNARETAIWMKREGLRSLRLVTAQYHMPRSLLLFRRAMPDAPIVPHPVFPERVRSGEWWRWPGTARLLVQEYLKYLAALAFGWAGEPHYGGGT